MLTCLLVVAVFLCIIHILFNYNEKARLMKRIPGPKNDFIIGNALAILLSPGKLYNILYSLFSWKIRKFPWKFQKKISVP